MGRQGRRLIGGGGNELQILEIQPEQDEHGQCHVRLLTENDVASRNPARLPYVLPKFGQAQEEDAARVAAPSQGQPRPRIRAIPRTIPSVSSRGLVEARQMPAVVA